MKEFTVWGWGDDYEDAKINSEACVKKLWRSTTKECHIMLVGRNRDEGITFGIDIYTRDAKSVGSLVDGLLSTALMGRNKVYEIKLEFLEEKASDRRTCLKRLEEVEKENETLMNMCIEKVKEDPRVKPLAEDRKVLVFPDMTLLSELELEYGAKMLVGAFHFDFQEMMKFVSSLSDELIKKKLAKRIVGYELLLDVDELEFSDIDVTEDEVLVDLATRESGKNIF